MAAGGCVLLAVRPSLVAWTGEPVPTLLAVFVVLLVVGCWWPAPGRDAVGRRGSAAAALVVGLAAFSLARLLGGGEAPAVAAALWPMVALNTLAAVAEEAFFRRFLFDTLLTGGVAVAVAGTAALFAVVHVPVYGLWVLPVDLAAGAVLSWQRLASGSWHVPAVTHVVANILVVI